MNAVEIEEAVSELAAAPFDPAEFPFAFLTAFGNKATTVNRLRTPSLNKSDVACGVLQARNIHLAVCAEGMARETMAALRESPKTAANKVKFLLATDGVTLEAEDLVSDEPPIVCEYPKFAEHFGFFLPLAGISTVRAIKNNPIDIKATGRLNKLYVELLKDNPEWATEARRGEMNQFMARLIFCFFAEDTGIFLGGRLFTDTLNQMSDSTSTNTHEVLAELFRAMATPQSREARQAARLRLWADVFPYVNGGLFANAGACPRFSRIARSYLLRAAELNWQEINPDIFGSMIQAVADDEERGELGMHYTSVPNILKVLNPLFLDDLRDQLEAAGDNLRKLRNLRKRLSAIRVFDPACGSGNFLVIAYREMRQIEHEIVTRAGDKPKSVIPLANFYGIEIKGFAAEIARLALLIAEFQCDVRLISQKEARLNVLPLHKTGQIHIGNALRLDWLEVCPPVEPSLCAEHEAAKPTSQSTMEDRWNYVFSGSEVYICGNPPYKGGAKKSDKQKNDLKAVFDSRIENWGLLDYVCGWFYKAFIYSIGLNASFAFVATNSIAQGQHISNLWRPLFDDGLKFTFAVRSFKWSNLAANDAGVTVVVIGGSRSAQQPVIYDEEIKRRVENINAYLLAQNNYWVEASNERLSGSSIMIKGNYYGLSEHLLLDRGQKQSFEDAGLDPNYIKKFYGSTEIINAKPRYCLWFEQEPTPDALSMLDLHDRLHHGIQSRSVSKDAISNGMLKRPHQFREMRRALTHLFAVPVVSSENRDYLPVDLLASNCIISNKCFALYDAPMWNLALVASRVHWVWIGTVCVRMRTDFSYSNTLGWNTFPLPLLTEKNKADLTRCAEDILLAREAHFPATIADLYDPENMPDDLRAAHDRNDETLERIYIGRRFRNDTERLEKLFDLYTKMTADNAPKVAKAGRNVSA